MQEKTVASKIKTPRQGSTKVQRPSTSALRHCTEPRNFVQCARRKLPSSKLPEKCQKQTLYQRMVKSPFKLSEATITTKLPMIDSAKSCLKNSPLKLLSARTFDIPQCRKSLSMVNLSPARANPEIHTYRSDISPDYDNFEEAKEKSVEILKNRVGIDMKMWMEGMKNDVLDMQQQSLSRAAGTVCHLLVINAWRRRREEIIQLNQTIDNLNQQVDHLHIQIIVLRRLLNTENDRVSKLTSEIHWLKSHLEDTTLQRDELKKDKEKIQEEAQRFKDLSEERSITEMNLRNDLDSLRNQLDSVDNQMARDREKLLKLREDKKILMEKISVSDAAAVERGKRADQAEREVEDLQLKLAAQVSLVTAAEEESKRYAEELKITNEERTKIEKRLESTKDIEKLLKSRVFELETKLCDRDAALRRIEAAYSLQISELNNLRERVVQQSQQNGWSSRVLQIAGSVVRAPRAIFRSLSLLSNSGITLTR